MSHKGPAFSASEALRDADRREEASPSQMRQALYPENGAKARSKLLPKKTFLGRLVDVDQDGRINRMEFETFFPETIPVPPLEAWPLFLAGSILVIASLTTSLVARTPAEASGGSR